MNSVTFNRATEAITGIDRPVLPFEGRISLPYEINALKGVYEDSGVQVQKTNEAGQPLYLDGDTEVTYQYKIVDGNDVEIPKVMLNQQIYKTYAITDNFTLFSADDVISAKIAAINQNNFRQLAYFSEDLSEADFNLALITHNANMGAGFIAINPKGQVTSNAIDLKKAVSTIEFYLEMQPDIIVEVSTDGISYDVVDVKGIHNFKEPSEVIYVRFTNNANTRRELYALGILA